MQELAILLGSMAGAGAAAAAMRLRLREGAAAVRIQNMGAGTRIRDQIGSLDIERDILNKTIARLYEGGAGVPAVHRDRLLLRYQHQLGVVLAKIDRLEAAKRHPDLGPVGDGLITLMDQKLSRLDGRLYELSARISAAGAGMQSAGAAKKGAARTEKTESVADGGAVQAAGAAGPAAELPRGAGGQRRPVEITTLTTMPRRIAEYPFGGGGGNVDGPEGTQEHGRGRADKRKTEGRDGTEMPRTTSDQEDILRDSPLVTGPGAEQDPKQAAGLPAPRRLPPKPGGDVIVGGGGGGDVTQQAHPDKDAAAGGVDEAGAGGDSDNDDDDDDLERIKGDILKALSKLEQAEV